MDKYFKMLIYKKLEFCIFVGNLLLFGNFIHRKMCKTVDNLLLVIFEERRR